jgi:uroporphyrinogen III methyltransferase/synthase
VVPGVTSAIAVPAYAGIPVTLRHSSTSFTVVTGHEDTAAGHEGSFNWDAVAKVGGTIIVMMGAARIHSIAARLIDGGLSPDTPLASITWGTRPEQRTLRATLGTIANHQIEAPATIVIGEVAAENLGWFEHRPLFGRRIVVTRAREQTSALSDKLADLGATVIELPAIAIEDAADGGAALRRAAVGVGEYDWLVLTSPNGVHRLLACMTDARSLAGVRIAAIGPGTASALADHAIRADLVPDRFVGEALLEAFPDPPAPATRRGRVLVARAAVARDILPDGLRERGWDVDVVEAYRTVAASPTPEQLASASGADAITFTSSSTVSRYLEVAGASTVPRFVACIGPITAATAREAGLHVDVEAEVYSVDGLVDALVSGLAGSVAPSPR